jgi:hypothetical protein
MILALILGSIHAPRKAVGIDPTVIAAISVSGISFRNKYVPQIPVQ